MLLISLTAIAVIGCSPDEASARRQVSRTEYALGTYISVRAFDADDSLLEAVFDAVLEIERKMSVTRDDYDSTELLELNRRAGQEPYQVSPDTYEVLQAAREYSELTEGAFDLTIGPLVDLWDIGSETASVPAEERIAEAADRVDYTKVRFEGDNSVYLEESGMGVDVGAIAKGYAADEAARILIDAGVEHALLDFGGNILTIGNKPDDTDWRIGIQHPEEERNEFLGILTSRDETVVSSGAYERYFMEDGVRYHHILDRRTGYPSRSGLLSSTIVAEESMAADALSTATFVLGFEEAQQLIESLPEVEGILVTEAGEVWVSPGLRERFELTAEGFALLD
ncbi:MAG: FAD:protein FMN transferase [Spirochaetaceae bacterium]